MPLDDKRMAYTVAEAAGLLGMSRTGIYSLCNSGKLQCTRLGTKVVITREAIEAMLAGSNPSPSSMKEAAKQGVIEAFQEIFGPFLARIEAQAAPDLDELPRRRRSRIRPVS